MEKDARKVFDEMRERDWVGRLYSPGPRRLRDDRREAIMRSPVSDGGARLRGVGDRLAQWRNSRQAFISFLPILSLGVGC